MAEPCPTARLRNFKTGQNDKLVLANGEFFVSEEPPRAKADPALYVPQDEMTQALLKAQLARQLCLAAHGHIMTNLDIVVSILELSVPSRRPTGGPG
jgi:hypothetical protein